MRALFCLLLLALGTAAHAEPTVARQWEALESLLDIEQRAETAETGFAVAFEDLPSGHIRELNVEYFQELDALHAILVEHGIAPVFQPVFHGYGWKGLQTAGNVVPCDEYAR